MLTKVHHSQSYGFSSSHMWMWELDYKESGAPKNWCFRTVLLGKTLKSPLDCKEIQPVHPKGDQSWVFIGRTDVGAETPILWPPDAKSWLIGKDRDAGKDWGQEEKEMTEDEIVGWHHQLNGHGFGWTLGVGDGQGGLACCSSWGCQELDMTENLNWTEVNCCVPLLCTLLPGNGSCSAIGQCLRGPHPLATNCQWATPMTVLRHWTAQQWAPPTSNQLLRRDS